MTTIEHDYGYDEDAATKIKDLLIGRRVAKVADNQIQLDDGRVLEFSGNEGCGGCSSGWYELAALNDVDNVITSVEFEDAPADDGDDHDGTYKIFVFADNKRINLATFEGSDGNGYYGTGYSIRVKAAA
jgi:hypothetical protein